MTDEVAKAIKDLKSPLDNIERKMDHFFSVENAAERRHSDLVDLQNKQVYFNELLVLASSILALDVIRKLVTAEWANTTILIVMAVIAGYLIVQLIRLIKSKIPSNSPSPSEPS